MYFKVDIKFNEISSMHPILGAQHLLSYFDVEIHVLPILKEKMKDDLMD